METIYVGIDYMLYHIAEAATEAIQSKCHIKYFDGRRNRYKNVITLSIESKFMSHRANRALLLSQIKMCLKRFF